MGKQVYISADYAESNGDRIVVEELTKWGKDGLHKVDFIDMAQVKSGSVSDEEDCRICDLKNEFNEQINASSAVIFVVGDKTASRTAGSACSRLKTPYWQCYCTPYKGNSKGTKVCKYQQIFEVGDSDDCGNINSWSYLQHEFEQAKKKNKKIVILYNSTRKETSWLPSYMKGYENDAVPFWKINDSGNRVGNYEYIKEALGFA